jgi:hypothetical protein
MEPRSFTKLNTCNWIRLCPCKCSNRIGVFWTQNIRELSCVTLRGEGRWKGQGGEQDALCAITSPPSPYRDWLAANVCAAFETVNEVWWYLATRIVWTYNRLRRDVFLRVDGKETCCGVAVRTSASYSNGPEFKCLPDDRLSWLRFLAVLQVLPWAKSSLRVRPYQSRLS